MYIRENLEAILRVSNESLVKDYGYVEGTTGLPVYRIEMENDSFHTYHLMKYYRDKYNRIRTISVIEDIKPDEISESVYQLISAIEEYGPNV